MRSIVRAALTVILSAFAAVLALPGTVQAAGTIPSHLSVGVNNPTCVGCTASATVSLWFDDYADPAGSVIHIQRTFGGEVTQLPDLTLTGSDWFYDYPQAEGTYEYLFTFDGDDTHAPAQSTGTITAQRQASYTAMNVWASSRKTLSAYAYLAPCHLNCVLVIMAGNAKGTTWEVARFTVPENGGSTPTFSFASKGVTQVYATYAGDDWYLPAQSPIYGV